MRSEEKAYRWYIRNLHVLKSFQSEVVGYTLSVFQKVVFEEGRESQIFRESDRAMGPAPQEKNVHTYVLQTVSGGSKPD